ncbi:hypothetical protein ACWF99_27530 [Nocardia sp. NPDC055002]|uniref:hypothetical protein n=1 Tax=Nocardia sp. NPDC056952 TaxID=3345979 RepID=UPI003637EA1D
MKVLVTLIVVLIAVVGALVAGVISRISGATWGVAIFGGFASFGATYWIAADISDRLVPV